MPKSNELFIRITPENFIKDHKPKIPPEKPQSLTIYLNLDKKDQAREAHFLQQEEIQKWYKMKWEAELYNYSSFKSLYSFKEVFEKHYQHLSEMLNEKLSEFKFTMCRNLSTYPALTVDFNLYPLKNVHEQPLNWDD